jgi:DNA-binding transcriptional MerR regulator
MPAGCLKTDLMFPFPQHAGRDSDKIGGMEYQIGDFATISRLGIKTLRYYHEIGLLNPSRIESSSGYRYYDESCLARVRAIQQLKALQFSLAEIGELLDGSIEPGAVQQKMRNKLVEVEQQIDQFEEVRQRLQACLQNRPALLLMPNPVRLTLLPEQMVASIRFRGSYAMLSEQIPLLMQTCAAAVSGAPFSLYYDDHPSEDDNDIEICVPVRQALESGQVHSRQLPGGRAVSILHEGYYDQISLSYQAIVDYMRIQQLTPLYPSREVYLLGGYDGSPVLTGQYRTEIHFLVE